MHVRSLGTYRVSQSQRPPSLVPTSGSTLSTRLELFVTGFAGLSPAGERASISPER